MGGQRTLSVEMGFRYWGSGDWLKDYSHQKLGVKWSAPEDLQFAQFEHLGFSAFSWKDCLSSWKAQTTLCIRLIQVNTNIIRKIFY